MSNNEVIYTIDIMRSDIDDVIQYMKMRGEAGSDISVDDAIKRINFSDLDQMTWSCFMFDAVLNFIEEGVEEE